MVDHDVLQYNYTDNPAGMRVVGISAHVFLHRPNINPHATPEYLLLYEATPDTFELKAQVRWFEDDTAGRPDGQYMINLLNCHNTTNYNALSYMSYARNSNFAIKIFDMYFDKPVTVYDSFYVGGTSRGQSVMYGPEHEYCWSFAGYITFVTSNTNNYDTTCFMPSLWKIWDHRRESIGDTSQWYWARSTQFMMILPIIEVVDTSFANAPVCPVVSGLFSRGNYTDTVTLRWDYDSLHSEYEVWYGPEDALRERGAIVALRTNWWQFTDASFADTRMIAYVRTVCHEYDTLRYSEWSNPIRFTLHHREDTTGHSDIGVPEAEGDLSRYVQLMPNPASGSVLVGSSYGIDRVEAYDVRGEKVMEQPTEGRTVIIDVTAWPKGAYVLLVRTSVGTVSKRLVVQ